ncbi:N-formylglutamate amidohydrolase [Qipengyuania sp. G39]|uniref:N-formylglutamate amidohydrolase n=1 Tax=Qipengyuania profundimaris TaxID=3067652 RepID=A0ABT9HQW3_9SPHN|nr:N-formylglutamate amidohydrolase [Qipengyuania sp. G39]MDP4575539.1 N-formylglutamate amidohydrolase [Qipengyuania sp. G39]
MSAGDDTRDPLSMEGGSIPNSDAPAFRMSDVADAEIPFLIAAPHGGRHYSTDIWEKMRTPHSVSLKLEDRLVDQIAKAVSIRTGAAALIAYAPRALIDLNRDPEDIDWDMVSGSKPDRRIGNAANRRARAGLGLVPRRLLRTGEIWKAPLSRKELEQRVGRVHTPYHHTLNRMLQSLRDKFGVAFLLDLHSMPPLAPTKRQNRQVEFVVGDRFGASAPNSISTAAVEFLERRGRVAERNSPYAGGYILDRHARPMGGIFGLQLEICRSAYLDHTLTSATPRMGTIVNLVAQLVICLNAQISHDLRPDLRDAAE